MHGSDNVNGDCKGDGDGNGDIGGVGANYDGGRASVDPDVDVAMMCVLMMRWSVLMLHVVLLTFDDVDGAVHGDDDVEVVGVHDDDARY